MKVAAQVINYFEEYFRQAVLALQKEQCYNSVLLIENAI
jgi:hypothetical protein